MPTLPVHIDVLLVNYRTGDLTRDAATAVAGPGVHLWAWDNSGEMLVEGCRGLDGLLGDGTNTYYAPANNALFHCCRGEFVLLLNPDVILDHEALLHLVEALEVRPNAWGAAPRLLNADGSDQRYIQRLPSVAGLLADRVPPLRGRLLKRAYEHYMATDVDLRTEQVVEQPPAACLLIRRERAGAELFDPSYRLFFNDTDLARRLNTAGECWLIPSVTATHLRGESFRRERRTSGYRIAREYDRTLLRYARRNVAHWPLLLPVIALRLILSIAADVTRFRRR